MTGINDVNSLIGHTAVDSSGDKIGKIGAVYLDDRTEEPLWVTVSTGLFGDKESFAPLYGATRTGDDLQLAVTKDLVKDAPNLDADGHLEDSENDALHQHYAGYLGSDSDSGRHADTQGVGTGSAAGDNGGTGGGMAGGTGEVAGDTTRAGHDTSGPNTDDAMTRSEERVNVGTERVEAGRARLRKYVVTENVTQTVPVSHEEVRVVHEPITEGNVGSATDGPAISEEEHEVTLHEERPVVEKETVPVERVALGTETVTEQATVNEQVRKEQIDESGVERS